MGVKASPSSSTSAFLHLLTGFATPPQAHSNDLCAEPSQHFCLDLYRRSRIIELHQKVCTSEPEDCVTAFVGVRRCTCERVGRCVGVYLPVFFFTMGYSLFFNCESKKYYLKLKMPKATLWEENSRPFVEHPHRARIILCRWENPIIYQVNAWKTIDFMFLIISNQRIWFFPFQNGWHSCSAPDRRVIQAFIDI